MARSKGKRLALAIGVLVVLIIAGVTIASWDTIRAHYVFWRRFERLPDNEQGYPEFRHRQTGIVFVGLPGGRFTMGSAEVGSEQEHRVSLNRFMISKFEVTQAEWQKVMGEVSSVFPGEELPVDNVSWDDCVRFCEATGLVLPTEAQWEYACRGGASSPDGGSLDEVAWYFDNRGNGTRPGGRKRANAFGLHDTQGNVWEWCADTFEPRFYQRPESTELDPVCHSESVRRVIRGGDWLSQAVNCRPSNRGWRDRSFRSSRVPITSRMGGLRLDSTTVGFRVAFSLQ